MEVRTARGFSPPLAFELAGRPGTKTLRDKRNYTLTYFVNVKAAQAVPPNTMYLWIPRPARSAAQRNAELLFSSIEPLIDDYRGVSLFKIDNLPSGKEIQISLSWKVEVYGVETSVSPPAVRLEQNSPITEAYTQSSPQLPADDPRIIDQAAAILGRERNPYLKALRIYEWLTGGNFTWESQFAGDIFAALETKRIDSYLAALLYCTLLRSAGVSCQPVAGVLAGRNRLTMNHYWAEFWLDGLGWIPVDPAMGAAALKDKAEREKLIPASYSIAAEQPIFYFGNIDSQRIIFSRGFANLSPMDPRGRTVAHNRSWSLQNIQEEVIGGIESYSSLWGDVTITGIYAQ
jgi:transglutaminase-like putative cysteine protease